MPSRLILTDAQREATRAFIRGTLYEERYREGRGWSYHARHAVTRQQIDDSYQSWARGGRAWDALQSGGTGIIAALVWYQHVHRPGSREWRPSVIIRALVEAAERWMLSSPARPSQDREGVENG
jgi:hypothetical protein